MMVYGILHKKIIIVLKTQLKYQMLESPENATFAIGYQYDTKEYPPKQ